MKFQPFNKIPRLSRDITITEKVDGSNANVVITNSSDFYTYFEANEEDYKDKAETFFNKYCLYVHTSLDQEFDLYMFAGSRNRWLNIDNDNFGFASWVKENSEELIKLGEGLNYGEWFGSKIQCTYSLKEKRFALFNVNRWHKYGEEPRLISINPKTQEKRYTKEAPKCCEVVPILFQGEFTTENVEQTLKDLEVHGSYIVPGYKNPEGIVIFHHASGQLFKKTIKNDEKPKGH